jgi:3-phytase
MALAAFSFVALQSYSSAKEKNYTVINETYSSKWNDEDNIDSPAFWQSADKKTNLLIATSKARHNLFVYNAETGKLIKNIGEKGDGLAQFKRPNGIWVIDDYLLVCERDNHRIQILTLPDFKSIGFIGDNDLIKPYGLSVYKEENKYIMYVTDQYEAEDGSYLPLDSLNRRVKKYSFSINNGKINSSLAKCFGDTEGKGILFIVESIYADKVNNKILIAEEDKNQNSHKVYDLDGNFLSIVVGKKQFEYQAEGIALYDAGNGEGYWFCMDQDYYVTNHNTIHIYDRKSFKYIASFITGKTNNTDGIWLTQVPFGKFKKGALFAVNNDGGVSAFDLDKILTTMKLKP